IPRRSLVETAFFFPHLTSDTNGRVRITFTVPETLTEWRFIGFAHDNRLRTGLIEDSAITSKELMVQPNPPRFLREGDQIEFAVKVINQSDQHQEGIVRLTLADALSGRSADELFNNTFPEKTFSLPPRQSASFAWELRVPEGLSAISYKAIAATTTLSDGEEAMLPTITRRVLVTESLPMPISGSQTQTFKFAKLAQASESPTLRHQSLTLQVVSNPAWYAVMALPYLMEFPYECSEQVFNRYYANSLARFIANSDAKIRQIFDLWKNTPALESPLNKNAELKAVALEETPWICEAENESQARRNIGTLFDDNRLNSEIEHAMRQLQESQLADGAWPWFPGGPPNDYITMYISSGFGRLRHLGLDIDVSPASRAIQRMDSWITGVYNEIIRQKTEQQDHLTPLVALYLYSRTFFIKETPVPPQAQPAFSFFVAQSKDHWPSLHSRQSQAHIALALNRLGDTNTAHAILESLKERSVTHDELGRFWPDPHQGWFWYEAPIETQSLMIEAFAEIAKDTNTVEECKTWLLRQKQTRSWKTTKATADAVYALLLRGRNPLEDTQPVEVSIGNVKLVPSQSRPTPSPDTQTIYFEPGTGFFQQRFAPAEIKPEMATITIHKPTGGIAWASVHWQYFEDVSKVTPHLGTPLKLNKSLFTKINTSHGPALKPVTGPLNVGDELVVRVELRVDRDMEFIHLKDHRASGTEPVDVLSGYRSQDGLTYYQSTRD
ncbi:MAG: alpha-2-macroglobulin family protein, partial [Verrucomicrobiae bacterium]|nr:alpha-2-macroglobulin family protein [Verrucomicrobiae bacterium]